MEQQLPLVTTAPQVGIRETRRIKGAHVLIGEEFPAMMGSAR